MVKTKKKQGNNKIRCEHCGPVHVSHFGRWSEDLFYYLFFSKLPRIPLKVEKRIFEYFNKILISLRVLELSDDIKNEKIFLRTRVFIEEAVKLGIEVKALKSKWGFINHFYMRKNGRRYFFEGLPLAEGLSKNIDKIDDKIWTKKKLKEGGFPIVEGKEFWFFQKKSGYKWASKNITLPVIVKPTRSSMSQHVTMNINDDKRLREGIRIALQHGPKFIVEKHLRDKCVFRVNVIDFENMAAVKRIPAHIVGDGTKTIQQLVDEKNQDPQRGEACSEDCSTFKLLITDRTHELLQEKGYTLGSVPKENELVFLQDKIILDIGADIEELSGRIHPDNRKLFTDIAKYFNLYLVGIDFLADDISVSWKDQGCAIIELNSMPYIDIHHHPTIGKSVNVGKYLAEMVDKHYFS